MFDFHEKRKIRTWLYSKVVVSVLFLIAGFLMVSAYNRYTVSNDMKSKLDARGSELQELQERAHVLESKVKYLENERGVEEELRNRFDVAKEGEQVIILLDPKRDAKVSDRKQPDVVEDTSEENGASKRSVLNFLKFW